MISCTLRMFGSDSIQNKIDVQSVPCVGDKLCIGNSSYKIVEVQHEISFESQLHKIVVTYKSDE